MQVTFDPNCPDDRARITAMLGIESTPAVASQDAAATPAPAAAPVATTPPPAAVSPPVPPSTPTPPQTPVSAARLREVFGQAYAVNPAEAMAASERARASYGVDADHWTPEQISETVTAMEAIAVL